MSSVAVVLGWRFIQRWQLSYVAVFRVAVVWWRFSQVAVDQVAVVLELQNLIGTYQFRAKVL